MRDGDVHCSSCGILLDWGYSVRSVVMTAIVAIVVIVVILVVLFFIGMSHAHVNIGGG